MSAADWAAVAGSLLGLAGILLALAPASRQLRATGIALAAVGVACTALAVVVPERGPAGGGGIGLPPDSTSPGPSRPPVPTPPGTHPPPVTISPSATTRPPAAPPVTTPRTTAPPAPVPAALVGTWQGGANPSGDQYYESLALALAADGRYSLVRAGVLQDSGRCHADGTTIWFRPGDGQPYTMAWRIVRPGGLPVLQLLQRPGYVTELTRTDG